MRDDKDKEILGLLKQNARMTNVEIAKVVGLTEGAVRARVNKMIANKVITKFTIETSEPTLSFAVVMVKAKNNTKEMMREISKAGVMKFGYEISGDYDACLIIEGPDMESIDEKIDKIRDLQTVIDTKTFIVLKKW